MSPELHESLVPRFRAHLARSRKPIRVAFHSNPAAFWRNELVPRLIVVKPQATGCPMNSSRLIHASAAALLCCALAGCGDTATLPENASIGSDPPLPSPVKNWFPTIHIATATGWPEGKTPIAGEGLKVSAFAGKLE